MDTVILFHSVDYDGWCSGALFKRAYPDAELKGINYGDPVSFKSLIGKRVIVVDYCFEPYHLMKNLQEISGEIIWIDHHKSAINNIEKLGYNLPGKQRIGISACELTWEYLHPNKDTPLVVRLLGKFDTFSHEEEPRALPFNMGMKQYDANPEYNYKIWHYILSDEWPINDIITQGYSILNYLNKEYNNIIRLFSFVTEFEGYEALAINLPCGGSMIFSDHWKRNLIDQPIALSFGWNPKSNRWKISLYSTDNGPDVSQIAVKYSGGGHRNAAGFEVNELPFKIK